MPVVLQQLRYKRSEVKVSLRYNNSDTEGQMSRSREVEDGIGGLEEASFSTPFG